MARTQRNQCLDLESIAFAEPENLASNRQESGWDFSEWSLMEAYVFLTAVVNVSQLSPFVYKRHLTSGHEKLSNSFYT